MNNDQLEEVLVQVYEDGGGPSAVFDWVRDNQPDWEWEWCVPCHESTPTVPEDGVCAVCFDVKRQPAVETVLAQLAAERALADQLYEALATCRPWIDDYEQGDLALSAYEAARRSS